MLSKIDHLPTEWHQENDDQMMNTFNSSPDEFKNMVYRKVWEKKGKLQNYNEFGKIVFNTRIEHTANLTHKIQAVQDVFNRNSQLPETQTGGPLNRVLDAMKQDNQPLALTHFEEVPQQTKNDVFEALFCRVVWSNDCSKARSDTWIYNFGQIAFNNVERERAATFREKAQLIEETIEEIKEKLKRCGSPTAISTTGSPWVEFTAHIDSENFNEAGRMISEGRINIEFHSDFYDSKIKELLLPLTGATRYHLDGGVDRNASLRKILRITEFFDSKGIESSYCRICRAAVYQYMNEESKLKELIPVLCRPRGYHQASDLLELNQLKWDYDEPEMRKVFFAPLEIAIIEYIEEKNAKIPIASANSKTY